jgi:hypothetical protein
MDIFLKESDSNVVVVSSFDGKAKPGIIISSFLLY